MSTETRFLPRLVRLPAIVDNIRCMTTIACLSRHDIFRGLCLCFLFVVKLPCASTVVRGTTSEFKKTPNKTTTCNIHVTKIIGAQKTFAQHRKLSCSNLKKYNRIRK